MPFYLMSLKKFLNKLNPLHIEKCEQCGPLAINHWQNWTSALIDFFNDRFSFINPLAPKIDKLIDKIFLGLGLITKHLEFPYTDVSLRSTVFIDEAKKYGIKIWALKSAYGFINYFQMEVNNRIFSFQGLPQVEFIYNPLAKLIDDKAVVKKYLQNKDIPLAEGQSFWWFEKKKALQYGLKLGFPLVVKPRWGSMSQHTTLNISDIQTLQKAIKSALIYNPALIIERFIKNTRVFRATMIDFQMAGCVERIPAFVKGNGEDTIQQLIEEKNQDPRRGISGQKDYTIFRILITNDTYKILNKYGYNLQSIPKKDELIYLQEKIILDLGADLIELTSTVHPDNEELFEKVAQIFKTHLVGIDFLAEDISKSYKEQNCAIVELNSLPYIDMHHFPSVGEPVNVAKKICEMVLRYYK